MEEELKAGSILIANGTLNDPNFKRAVILLCAHNDEGSFGLVLNRPTNISISKILPDFRLKKNQESSFYYGGPVKTDSIQILHKTEDFIPAALQVSENVWLGGNLDILKKKIINMDSELFNYRFFIGYAGWGPEQLYSEIESNSWFVCSAKNKFIFSKTPTNLWSEILCSMGGPYAFLATMPADPTLN